MGYFHVVVTAGARCILHYISEWAATVHCLFLVGLSITISTIQLHAFEYLSSTTLTWLWDSSNINLVFSAMGRPQWILHYLYGWGATVHSLPLGSHNARGRPQCIIYYWVATAHSSLLGAPGLLHVLYQCGPQCILKYWGAQCVLHYVYEKGGTVHAYILRGTVHSSL